MAVGDKSFKELTVAELRAVAEQFAVDIDGKTKKADILDEITEMGVTWEMYAATLEPEQEEEEVDVTELPPTPPVEDEDIEEEESQEEEVQILVKMIRTNFSYEVRGYKFTRQNPFALVDEETADYLIEEDQGFRMASPRELKEFYGG